MQRHVAFPVIILSVHDYALHRGFGIVTSVPCGFSVVPTWHDDPSTLDASKRTPWAGSNGEIVPREAELWCRPDPTVLFRNPAQRILEAANELEADLIVLGVRDAAGYLGAATHLERTTAHKVVARAICPVLTVRG